MYLKDYLGQAKSFYDLENFEYDQVGGHDGGRNLVYVCKLNGEKKYVLRISARSTGFQNSFSLRTVGDSILTNITWSISIS